MTSRGSWTVCLKVANSISRVTTRARTRKIKYQATVVLDRFDLR